MTSYPLKVIWVRNQQGNQYVWSPGKDIPVPWPESVHICLYETLVSTHLEYASLVWAPYKAKDIEILENVQRRCTGLTEDAEIGEVI